MMFIFDPINQGLELLAHRELQKAESVFLQIINDPYAQQEELLEARTFLNDIRACQSGGASLDFDHYKKLTKKTSQPLDAIDELLVDVYFSSCQSYDEFDKALAKKIPAVINRLRPLKIQDIVARDKLFEKLEKSGIRRLKKRLGQVNRGTKGDAFDFDSYRWKTIFRKFIEQIHPVLLERHLELLDYILQTGEIQLLDAPSLTTLTPKSRWIIQSTLKNKWFLLRSYFFKARAEAEDQFGKREGTRKHWEEVRYKKIKIFEECRFSEQNIQKFLFTDKLNYNTLKEIHEFALSLGLVLKPRDVSLALRGVNKAREHIKERAGILVGFRKEFQNSLRNLKFSKESSYKIARQVKRSSFHQVLGSFQTALKVASDEIYWYRIPPQSESLRKNIEAQCCKHLSTVRIHMFERGRLNKILLQEGQPLIRRYLVRVYGEGVKGLHCYFRLATIHQYYKLKFFQYHDQRFPSVSELIKISRKDFQPLVVEGYRAFLKKKRLDIPAVLYEEIKKQRALTSWENEHTTPEEKLLLKFWFLMDHGVPVTQRLVQKGVFRPGADLWALVKGQGSVCNS